MYWASRRYLPFFILFVAVKYYAARGSFPQVQTPPVYFDRADVKAAIHAPPTVNWEVCNIQGPNVFPDGDASLPPAFTVLPNVIEKSNRSVIVHGLADFRLIAEGTRIVLQK
jgi:carboxypeptidase D